MPIGSAIGAIAGLVFVLVNAGALPAAMVLRVVGVAGFVAVLFVVLRAPDTARPAPSRSALRIYAACVVGEVVAIPVGAAVISNAAHEPTAVVAWVVVVVGVHFGPFAKAFALPMFGWLAGVLCALGVAGLGLAFAVDAVFAAAAAVVAGYVLLVFSAAGPYLNQTRT